jgi:hypothetical protein
MTRPSSAQGRSRSDHVQTVRHQGPAPGRRCAPCPRLRPPADPLTPRGTRRAPASLSGDLGAPPILHAAECQTRCPTCRYRLD